MRGAAIGSVLPQELTTDGVREASQSHASESPSSGKGMESPIGPAIGEQQFTLGRGESKIRGRRRCREPRHWVCPRLSCVAPNVARAATLALCCG